MILVKFSIKDDNVWLVTQRELQDLDRSEAVLMLQRVGNFADDIDDKLKTEFPE